MVATFTTGFYEIARPAKENVFLTMLLTHTKFEEFISWDMHFDSNLFSSISYLGWAYLDQPRLPAALHV